MNFKVFVTVFIFFSFTQAADWCSMPHCAPYAHIACNNNGVKTFECRNFDSISKFKSFQNFHSRCVSPRSIKLTPEQIELFLDLHNAYRNKIASGKLPGFLPAKKMAKVTWNDELAMLADLNTKQCKIVGVFSLSFNNFYIFLLFSNYFEETRSVP